MEERLQKIMAAAGIASRRAAEDLILRGDVSVNGKRITEPGTKADPERDHIKVRGKLINPQLLRAEKRYFLVNKPRGYLSSAADPKNRPLVIDLVPASERRGLHPVGRLDFNTEGLIVLTNDGELTRLLTQAGSVAKIYEVKVKGTPSEEQIEMLRRGVRIDRSRTAPAEIKFISRTKEGGNSWYEITLREGKNQQIRRMFDSIGHSVTKLRRIRIGHLTGQGITPGHYRNLKPGEIKKFFQNPSDKTPSRKRK